METTPVETTPVEDREAIRRAKREQWLRYLLFVAEEKICASCYANRFKKWLPENHG